MMIHIEVGEMEVQLPRPRRARYKLQGEIQQTMMEDIDSFILKQECIGICKRMTKVRESELVALPHTCAESPRKYLSVRTGHNRVYNQASVRENNHQNFIILNLNSFHISLTSHTSNLHKFRALPPSTSIIMAYPTYVKTSNPTSSQLRYIEADHYGNDVGE